MSQIQGGSSASASSAGTEPEASPAPSPGRRPGQPLQRQPGTPDLVPARLSLVPIMHITATAGRPSAARYLGASDLPAALANPLFRPGCAGGNAGQAAAGECRAEEEGEAELAGCGEPEAVAREQQSRRSVLGRWLKEQVRKGRRDCLACMGCDWPFEGYGWSRTETKATLAWPWAEMRVLCNAQKCYLSPGLTGTGVGDLGMGLWRRPRFVPGEDAPTWQGVRVGQPCARCRPPACLCRCALWPRCPASRPSGRGECSAPQQGSSVWVSQCNLTHESCVTLDHAGRAAMRRALPDRRRALLDSVRFACAASSRPPENLTDRPKTDLLSSLTDVVLFLFFSVQAFTVGSR